MKIKMKLLCLALVMMLALTGCLGEDYKFVIHSDGSGTLSFSFMLDTQFYNQMMETQTEENGEKEKELFEGFTKSKREFNDNVYTCFEKTISFKSPEELKNILENEEEFNKAFPINEEGEDDEEMSSNLTITKANVTADSFEVYVGGVGEKLKDYFCLLCSVTFDKEIVYTNGKLSDDKKTASWEFATLVDGVLLQASTIGEDSFAKDQSSPVIKGIKDKQYYKKNVVVTAEDDKGIKKLTCDGQGIANNDEIEEEGRHVVIAEDFSGNKVKKIFYIDCTDPTVSGVKNNRTYKKGKVIKFRDASGIKSATLNGKKVKSGVKMKKSGGYRLVVKDKAGNVTTVRFKIKR